MADVIGCDSQKEYSLVKDTERERERTIILGGKRKKVIWKEIERTRQSLYEEVKKECVLEREREREMGEAGSL